MTRKNAKPIIICDITTDGVVCGQKAQDTCVRCLDDLCYQHSFHSALLHRLGIAYCWECANIVLQEAAEHVMAERGAARDVGGTPE